MDIISFLVVVLQDVSPAKIIENLTVALTIYAVGKRYFARKADEVTDAIKEVKDEMHSLNQKVGDVARGLDMVKTSHDERIAKNEFRLAELAIQVGEIKQQLLPHN